MSIALQSADVERFRDLIEARIGLNHSDEKLGWLAGLMRRHMQARGLEEGAYLQWLAQAEVPDEVAPLIQDLTVAETYFFRHIEQLDALCQEAVPRLLNAHGHGMAGGLRILSAGCASGEEAYSIAMLLDDLHKDAGVPVQIDAVDLNPAVVAKARRARYAAWSLRETPSWARDRWFRQDARELTLDERIRARVRFDVANLNDDDAPCWHRGPYDVVFCRNVLMYFSTPRMEAVIQRLARVMRPGGYLFLGHAETLRGLQHDFCLCHSHGTFYYRLGMAGQVADQAARRNDTTRGSDWVQSIEQASRRVHELTRQAEQMHADWRALAPSVPPVASAVSHADIHAVLGDLQRERLDLAGQKLDALERTAPQDLDLRILRAALLLHAGQAAAARDLCAAMPVEGRRGADALHVQSLCQAALGDQPGAIVLDQAALRLDASFAMPRLHLGLLARRDGRLELARQELSRAHALLPQEDEVRVRLFGGGFSREMLVTLSHTELLACGGAPACGH